MRKTIIFLGVLGLLFLPSVVLAQGSDEGTGTSKQVLTEAKKEVKGDSQEARQEERALREQIREAEESGDSETALRLREQLREMHRENVGQMQEDKDELGELRKDLKEDKKAARQESQERASQDGPQAFKDRLRERFGDGVPEEDESGEGQVSRERRRMQYEEEFENKSLKSEVQRGKRSSFGSAGTSRGGGRR